jgi:hypothetical protein
VNREDRTATDSISDAVVSDSVPSPEPAHQAPGLARVGLAVWSTIGFAVLLVVVFVVFGTISEIAIPVLLGAVIAVVLKPVADGMVRRGLGSAAAAGIVLAGLLVIREVDAGG